MKKNRPGVLLRVIGRPEDRETLSALVLQETTTLGVRVHSAERRVQTRRIVEVETQYGKVRVKVAGDGSFAPEYEDCRRLALATGTPLTHNTDLLCECGASLRSHLHDHCRRYHRPVQADAGL
jgi:uncharacterized protein (DUF111 family)